MGKKVKKEVEFPGYLPNGDLPPGWEYPSEEELAEEDGITPELIARATLEGKDFVPKNAAEQELKDEIAEIEESGGMVDVPD